MHSHTNGDAGAVNTVQLLKQRDSDQSCGDFCPATTVQRSSWLWQKVECSSAVTISKQMNGRSKSVICRGPSTDCLLMQHQHFCNAVSSPGTMTSVDAPP